MQASLSYRPWYRFYSARNSLLGVLACLGVLVVGAPATATQAAWVAFIAGFFVTAWLMSRGALEGISVERRHRQRVFEGDFVPLQLIVRQQQGLAQSLVMVEDQFLASLSVRHRHLIPMLSPKWEASLQYYKEAERHRGLYMIGPVQLWAADPMGIFYRSIEADCITTLTVYPRAISLGGYKLLGNEPAAGPSMEKIERIGHAEEIIGVRAYQPGDPINRIHWRTSMRRGELHTMQADTHVQTEVALYLDLTRRARFGTGAESTTEIAVGCATSILTEAGALRHRISLTWAQKEVEAFPAGAGLAHLHLLLDRLAMVSFGGELKFWNAIAAHAALLNRGSRAIFIAPAATTPADAACDLVRQLTLKGVAADVILIDDSRLIRMWRDQEPPALEAPIRFQRLTRDLERAGARVLPLSRGENAADLLPKAAEESIGSTLLAKP